MTVPHITIEKKHIDLAFESLGNGCITIDLCNKAIEIALAEQSTNVPHITIEQIAAIYLHESAETHKEILTRCNTDISAYNAVIKHRSEA